MASEVSAAPVVLVHGLWLTPRSWEGWKERCESRGRRVLAPAWPRMPGEVEDVRRDPSALNGLGLAEIVEHYEAIVRGLDRSPVIMGHSLGGLVTELLLDRGLGAAGVAISPAPVRGVLRVPPAMLRAIFPVLGNPANRNRTVKLTLKQFHYVFTNTMTQDEAKAAYDRYHVPGPGRPIFQAAVANLNPRAANKVDVHNGGQATASGDRQRAGPHRPGLGQQGGRQAPGQVEGRGGLQAVRGTAPLRRRARLGGGRRLRARLGRPPHRRDRVERLSSGNCPSLRRGRYWRQEQRAGTCGYRRPRPSRTQGSRGLTRFEIVALVNCTPPAMRVYGGCCARLQIGAAGDLCGSTLGRLVRVDPQRSAPSPRFKEPGMSISTPQRLSSRSDRPRGSDVPRFRSRHRPSGDRFPGWRWMAVWPAFPVAGYIGWKVGGRVDAVDAALVGGALTGSRPRRRPVVGRQGRARARGSVDRLQRRRLRRRAGGRRRAGRLRHRPRRARPDGPRQRRGARRRAGARPRPAGTPRARAAVGAGDAGAVRARLVRGIGHRHRRR